VEVDHNLVNSISRHSKALILMQRQNLSGCTWVISFSMKTSLRAFASTEGRQELMECAIALQNLWQNLPLSEFSLSEVDMGYEFVEE
jgi:hypothetical protein